MDNSTGISRLDCYEDMFKEITRKLYGEDPDHRTSSVQNEFETSVSYKNEEDTGNGTDSNDDGNWTCEDEPLKGTEGSRVASYHAGKATWRCYECGDIMTSGPREVAEHFMELHSTRIIADDGRGRHHPARKDYMHTDFKVEDVVSYLERLRERAERAAPPSRRTQETQTTPATLLPVPPTFLLQELPSTSTPQHLHQSTSSMSTSATTSASSKRYTCPYCPYGTDRRDLYTRHENIHREEKPFHCYICGKAFNRADHVKKHFLRMHREHNYELSRIRKPAGTTPPKPLQPESSATSAIANNANSQQVQHTNYQPTFVGNKTYQLQPNTSTATGTVGIYQPTTMPSTSSGILQSDVSNCVTGRRLQNGGCNSKSHLKASSKNELDRRFVCCYCSWTGVDNWCLKRHLNTHLKPYACSLCEYKAARTERLNTHVLKVHNKRMCSRCAYLADDLTELQAHQSHIHHINTPNTSAVSTTQAALPPNNRHQQPTHPVGGRPPPGPPVFPASTPAIVPTTTVIPPTTILGNEMVNSPATAATMAYPTEEEKRLYDDNDNDNAIVQANGNRVGSRIRDFNICRVCGTFKSDRNDECCSVYSNGNNNIIVDISNNDFICSNHFMSENTNINGNVQSSLILRNSHGTMIKKNWLKSYRRKERRKRPRKQSHPRKVIGRYYSELVSKNDEPLSTMNSLNCTRCVTDTNLAKMEECKENYGECRSLGSPRNLLKCYQCPETSLARGRSYRPYHTTTSLTLHKLWKHKQKSKSFNNHNVRTKLPVSSIMIEATVITSPEYGYDR